MTDSPDQLVPRIPTGAAVISPERIDVGFGYVAETGCDVMYLVLHVKHSNPFCFVMTPSLAVRVTDELHAKSTKLASLRTDPRSIGNGGNPHDD
ncbi:hypothetical protein A9X05_21355 [Mycobacterium sp. E3298]|uniref:hypothetical protein n=1 Tax=unclassified Mycobacterium TaxID=2642494 RepID=UPI00080053BC|nr:MULTISPECIES: hypothetical protein [unclassified Mycobacterium]OBG79045.1 hypothetical protein A5701_14945 [Mycobacterium sp. E3305]OBG79898.1 hypothetical protein A9X05_21355 [Mycobacterium sp. E3298]